MDQIESWLGQPSHHAADPVPAASGDAEPDALLPTNAADTRDGSFPDLDAGHIGLAVAGLAGLGLGGTAAAISRRRRPRS